MALFITEDSLRESFGLAYASEIHLPVGAMLTPAAKELINERKITIHRIDEQGRLFIESNSAAPANEFNSSEKELKKTHPLNTRMLENEKIENICLLCHSSVSHKTPVMTHLNNKLLVPKNHPRIGLRGKLDSAIAYCVLLQTEFENEPSLIQGFLNDIRSYLGKVLQSEVTEQLLELPYLGEISSDVYHKWSHNPLKYLGYDHMLADKRYGNNFAKLNYLRALVRELETNAAIVYIDPYMNLSREDIIAGLNRLSSAVYVTMILLWQYQSGNEIDLEQLISREDC